MLKKFITLNFAISVLGVISGVILARIFPPDTRGLIAQVILYSTYSASLSSATLREIVLSKFGNEQIISWRLNVLAIVQCAALDFLFIKIYDLQSYALYMYAITFLCYIQSLLLIDYQVKGKFVSLGIMKSITPFTYIIGLLLLCALIFTFGIKAKSEFIFVIYVLSMLWQVFFVIRSCKWQLIVPLDRKVKANYNEYIKVLFSVLITMVFSFGDKVIFPLLMDSDSFAYYIVASTLVFTPISILTDSLSNYLMVKIKDDGSIASVKMLFFICSFLSFIVLVIYFFSGILIEVVFGESYLKATEYVFLVGVISIFSSVRIIVFSVFRGLGYNDYINSKNFSIIKFMVFSYLSSFCIINDEFISFYCMYFVATVYLILISYLSIKEVNIR